jgi:hypothetical protein
MQLPRGVAIVRCQQGSQRVVLVSDALSHDQEIAARVLAVVLAPGLPYVLLLKTDVLRTLSIA